VESLRQALVRESTEAAESLASCLPSALCDDEEEIQEPVKAVELRKAFIREMSTLHDALQEKEHKNRSITAQLTQAEGRLAELRLTVTSAMQEKKDAERAKLEADVRVEHLRKQHQQELSHLAEEGREIRRKEEKQRQELLVLNARSKRVVELEKELERIHGRMMEFEPEAKAGFEAKVELHALRVEYAQLEEASKQLHAELVKTKAVVELWNSQIQHKQHHEEFQRERDRLQPGRNYRRPQRRSRSRSPLRFERGREFVDDRQEMPPRPPPPPPLEPPPFEGNFRSSRGSQRAVWR